MHRLQKNHTVLQGKTVADGRKAGFTLMEVIISLIVAAVLGTVLIQFMGTNLSGSAASVANVQKGFQLREIMEQITRDYRNWLKNSPGETISDFKTVVDTNYTAYVSTSQTEINPGNDGDIEILQVTVSNGGQTLVAFFTK